MPLLPPRLKAWVLPAALLALGSLCGCSGRRNAPPPATFSLATSLPQVSIPSGGSGLVTVTLSRLNGFTEGVDIALEGVPAGVTAQGALPTGIDSLRLAIVVAPGVAPQQVSGAVLKGTAGTLTQRVPLPLTITAALPTGPLPADRVAATGSLQRGGLYTQTLVVGEPAQATTIQAAPLTHRNGFQPDPRP